MTVGTRTLVAVLDILAEHGYIKELTRLFHEGEGQAQKAYQFVNPNTRKAIDSICKTT